MNQILLKRKAEALLVALRQHASSDSGVHALLVALSPLLDSSMKGEVHSPVEWRDVPGGRLFIDGSLEEFGDIEEAYAQFKIEVTGGESPALKMFRQSRGE